MKKIIKIMSLILMISIFTGYTVKADDITYSVEMGSLTTDGKFFPKGSSGSMDINKNIVINPSYLQYNYTSTKKDRFEYCINSGCSLKNDNDRFQGYQGGISINNNQKIVIDYNQLTLGENRISYMTFDNSSRSTDSISFYVYYYDFNVSASVDKTINPSLGSATSNKEEVKYSWQIVDLNNNVKNIGQGATVGEDYFKELAQGKYQLIFKGVFDGITSYGLTGFEIEKLNVTISLDKPINPSYLRINQSSSSSTISWEILNADNNQFISNGTTTNVTLPTAEGKYKINVRETNSYEESNASTTFTVSKPAISITTSGGQERDNYIINPTEVSFIKKLSNSTINWKLEQNGKTVSSNTTNKLIIPVANGDYLVTATEKSIYNVTSSATLKLRIEHPNVKIDIDDKKNPRAISISKSNVNSSLSWKITKNNIEINNGTSTNVSIPKEYGEYTLEAKETTRYNDVSSDSITFSVVAPNNGDQKTVKSGNNTYYYIYKNGKWFNNKSINVSGATITTYNYSYNAAKCTSTDLKPNNCSVLTQKIIQVKSGSKIIKITEYKYNNYQKLILHRITQKNSVNKNIVTYQRTISYYTNKRVNLDTTIKRTTANKYISRVKMKYRTTGYKYYQIKFSYKSGKIVSRYEYRYNKRGQTKSNKYGSAYRYKTTYKKGKALKSYRSKYSNKGKLSKAKVVKKRTSF